MQKYTHESNLTKAEKNDITFLPDTNVLSCFIIVYIVLLLNIACFLSVTTCNRV